MTLRSWISVSLWAVAALAVPAPHRFQRRWGAPTVTVKNGTLEGLHSDQYNQDYFLGIPFAQPPVGSLRFRVPQSINTSWRGTRSAKQYSNACVGYGSDDWPYPVLSEDCLYLNVVRPSGCENQSLPVAFWIHGGGLFEGSGIDPRYNLSYIVQRSVEIGKPMMAVSINYRLSMWGFITGDEVIESGNANLGFRDQRLALHWVQENIAAFGGSPESVTIWGESAGALSVGMQLTAYNGRDDSLFRGAVMESGNPINYGTFDTDNKSFINASIELGCANATDKLECLRAVPFETLNTFINTTSALGFNDGNRWAPIIDGDFIQGLQSEQLANGKFVHVPIIDGANSDEGTAFGTLPYPVDNETIWLDALTTFPEPRVLTKDQAEQVLTAYPADLSTYGLLVPANLPLNYTPPATLGAISRRSEAYYGDVVMIAPRRKTCQTWASNSLAAYCYRFNTMPNGLPDFIGVTHFQEVAWVFNNKQGIGYSANPFEGEPQSYYDLADVMSGAWVSFVVDQNPGSFWPEYELNSEGYGQNWVFDANVTDLGYVEMDDWRKEGIDFINEHAVDFYGR